MAAIDLKYSNLKIKDGDGNSITVKLGEGNFTYQEKVNRQYIKDRGVLDTVRNGDEEPVDVTLDATWEWITGTGEDDVTPEDAMKQRNGAAEWVSSSADICEPFAVDLVLEYSPVCGDTDPETITISDFRYETIDHDPKAGTLSFKGKANVTEATAVRGAIST